jgi:tetratricopeptide (TPR) repeat protein
LALATAVSGSSAWAADSDGQSQNYLSTSRQYFRQGQYFRAARYAFASIENGSDRSESEKAEAYSWVTLGLARARFYHSAAYFFIKTLQTGNKDAIRRVLTETQSLLVNVGPDLLRKYLVKHTQYEDYDAANRNAFLYSLGKDALLAHQEERAISYLNGIQKSSPLWPFSLQLRGSAYAIHGNSEKAIDDFELCVKNSGRVTQGLRSGSPLYRQLESEGDDLKARCMADVARTYYQAEKFDEADRAYDKIQKTSLVWPDILFEQAWTSFARQEYNRTLGKLVSYKSPALQFVFEPEIDVLRAQSYLALCLYPDANDVINEFHGRYGKIGELVKQFVESNAKNPEPFYAVGKHALRESIYSTEGFNPMLNRFVRGPYFARLVRSERDINSELEGIRRFGGAAEYQNLGRGFPGFLIQVLSWRIKSVHTLGGMFVKNSLIDYHAQLISNFEKIAFIKLEMLKRAKDQLIYKNSPHKTEIRGWGNQRPERKDYQYYWSFNGEFWNDELGDYVFGLESQCGGGGNR